MDRKFLENIKGLDGTMIDLILAENQRDLDAAKQSTGDGKAGTGGGKTFTQEEVNKIVSDRLAQERKKGSPAPEDERERDLKAREARLACRDYLDEKGLPKALLDAIGPVDLDAFKGTVERITAAFPRAFDTTPVPPPYATGTGSTQILGSDPLAAAFKSPKT